MNTGIAPKTFKKFERRCSDGSDRTRGNSLISFKEWLAKPIKLKRRRKDVNRINHEGNCQVRDDDQQGEAHRNDQEVQSTVVHYFPEP